MKPIQSMVLLSYDGRQLLLSCHMDESDPDHMVNYLATQLLDYAKKLMDEATGQKGEVQILEQH